MSDKEFEDCIDLIIQSGRVWDALYELQGYLDGIEAQENE